MLPPYPWLECSRINTHLRFPHWSFRPQCCNVCLVAMCRRTRCRKSSPRTSACVRPFWGMRRWSCTRPRTTRLKRSCRTTSSCSGRWTNRRPHPSGRTDLQHAALRHSRNIHSVFSLFRASTQAEAEDRFNAFIHRLPVFVTVVKEVSTLVCWRDAHRRSLLESHVVCAWLSDG